MHPLITQSALQYHRVLLPIFGLLSLVVRGLITTTRNLISAFGGTSNTFDGSVPSDAVERESGCGNFLGRQMAAQSGSALAQRLASLFVGALLANVLPVPMRTTNCGESISRRRSTSGWSGNSKVDDSAAPTIAGLILQVVFISLIPVTVHVRSWSLMWSFFTISVRKGSSV